MKIAPLGSALTQNTQSISNHSPSSIARATAIAAGQTPQEATSQETSDPQVNKIKRIKMVTQVSPDRVEPVVEPESAITDTNETKVPEETRPLSPQLVALAKERRALQVKERELAQREEALKTTQAFNPEEYVSKADLLANPLKVFEAGVTYDKLTEALLANPANPELINIKKDMDSRIEKLESQLAERDKMQEQQVLAQMTTEAKSLSAAGDDYQFIREADMVPDIIDGIYDHWKATGEVKDLVETMRGVEERLVENAVKAANLQKVKSRLTPAEITQTVQQTQQQTNRGLRTLTNRDNARPAIDRRARAIAAFNGSIK